MLTNDQKRQICPVETAVVLPYLTEIENGFWESLLEKEAERLEINFPPNVGELAKTLYPELTYDHAVPQTWVNNMIETLFPNKLNASNSAWKQVYQSLTRFLVWGYPRDGIGKIHGCPCPLTKDTQELIFAIYESKVKNGSVSF